MSCYAHSLAATRGFLSQGCVDLIREAVATLGSQPWVVDLGAGSGTTACAVWAERPDAGITTIDTDAEALEWCRRNLQAAGFSTEPPRWQGYLKDSASAAADFTLGDGWVDMLIVDADHTYEGVAADILAWVPKLKPDAPVFFHDYDAHDAPELYPGVKIAVDEAVERGDLVFVERRGWSALCRKPLSPLRTSPS